jgi:predicted O-methyltransferase YrrM
MRLNWTCAATLGVAAVALSPVSAQKPERVARNKQIRAYLAHMRQTQQPTMNVDVAEGERLLKLVLDLKARRVLEIGTSNGYSTVWMAMGLEETGGKIVSIEYDAGRHKLAVENFKKLKLDHLADLRFADALKETPLIEGPFDLVFIDAWKEDYAAYFDMIYPKVRSGGAIAAHDTTSYAKQMAPFLERIKSAPDPKTKYINRAPTGIRTSRPNSLTWAPTGCPSA